MKLSKKVSQCKDIAMRLVCMLSVLAMTNNTYAADNTDPIQDFMTESLKGIFGSGAGFWKVFILADIALATVASVKSKNPMVFVGVFVTALVPGFLIKKYVFPS